MTSPNSRSSRPYYLRFEYGCLRWRIPGTCGMAWWAGFWVRLGLRGPGLSLRCDRSFMPISTMPSRYWRFGALVVGLLGRYGPEHKVIG